MTKLEEIFNDNTLSSDKWQPYFEVYERYVGPYTNRPIHLVEIGVQKGGSLEMWSKYLHKDSRITGIDVDPECANLKYDTNNINVIIGDQGKKEFWDQTLPQLGDIDILIDDGGHHMHQQILTFETVFPEMKEGSLYICEDCHTSYMPYNGGGLGLKGTFIEYAKSLVDVIHYDWKESTNSTLEFRYLVAEGLTSVHFYDSIVVFEKLGKRRMERVAPRKFQ